MTNSAETILAFPCSFPVKAFGRSADDFEALVASIVRRHVPHLDDGAVVSRRSENSHYLSVTVTVIAENREQLAALYQELSSHARVLMVL